MANPITETRKRLDLAQEVTERFQKDSLGIILAGSVAYSPNLHVRPDSDVDLVVITEDIGKAILSEFVRDKSILKSLEYRYFDGFCFKEEHDGVDVSLHFFNPFSFGIITNIYIGDLRVYRQKAKEGSYGLLNFEGGMYDYWIKNIKIKEGFRTIVPSAFLHNDTFHLGIHKDKLLSNAVILHETGSFISKQLEFLWQGIARYLRDEGMRLEEKIDLGKRNILNALSRKDKMSDDIKNGIQAKTLFYLQKICPDDKIIISP